MLGFIQIDIYMLINRYDLISKPLLKSDDFFLISDELQPLQALILISTDNALPPSIARLRVAKLQVARLRVAKLRTYVCGAFTLFPWVSVLVGTIFWWTIQRPPDTSKPMDFLF